MPYIYKIVNDINNKIYIGKTSITIQNRWKQHQKDATSTSKVHRPLYSAMRKYGINHFHIEEIEEVENDEIACKREIYWIEYYDSFNNGYNATKGGDGKQYADYDLIFTLFQDGKTGKEISMITGYTDMTITKALRQKGVSEEARKQRGKINSQQVAMLDINTLEILKTFSSITEAERYLNKKGGRRHITEVCRGKRKTAYGYKWKYLNF